jgi:prepilin-type N-terminal cleavage/methylation domain-containing protein
MRRRPSSRRGFTLVEVMIALAIVALTAVVLLDRRVEIVRDAARSRDLRTAWMLASVKMGELELDPALWAGVGGQSHGDFSELDPEYARFTWEYLIQREPVDFGDAAIRDRSRPPRKPPELMRLTLGIRAEGFEEPLVLEAQFPIAEPKAADEAEAGKPGSGQPPAGEPPERPK